MKEKFLLILLLFVMFFISSCDSPGVVDDPPPFLQIIEGPEENSVLAVDYVNFAWIGADQSFEFQYRLVALDEDNVDIGLIYDDWSDYSDVDEVFYQNLDESKYSFEIMAKSQGFIEGPIKRKFTIDAFRGPSLSFFKSDTEIKIDSINSIDIWLEEVDSLVGARIVIAFEKEYLELTGYSIGNYIETKNLELLLVPDLNNNNNLNTINNTGKIDINCAILPEYLVNTVSGSGSLIKLFFRGKAVGTSTIQYTIIDFYQYSNGEYISVDANPPKSGLIHVVAP